MNIKKIFTGEIIILLELDKYKYVKQYYTLDGQLKKHKVIDINRTRDSRTNRYWSSVQRMFEYLINIEGFEEVK